MPVKHIRIHGTRKEIDFVQSLLPESTSDRVLTEQRIYDHMNKHLGVEIWEYCVSKQTLSRRVLDVLELASARYPTLLYRVTDKSEHILNGQTNFPEHGTPDFPGPFGALCKRYGKTCY